MSALGHWAIAGPARAPSVVQVEDEFGERAHQARWYVVVVSPRRPSF